jgi:hypothetical protein
MRRNGGGVGVESLKGHREGERYFQARRGERKRERRMRLEPETSEQVKNLGPAPGLATPARVATRLLSWVGCGRGAGWGGGWSIMPLHLRLWAILLQIARAFS